MKKRRLQIGVSIILTSIILVAMGCASIVSKSNYPLMVNSIPQNANLTVTNKKGVDIYKGKTPTSLMLKAGAGFFSKASYLLKFEKDGYQTKTIPVEMTFDGWYVGNLIFGGLIGMLIVDPATGAMWKLDIAVLDVPLQNIIALNQDRMLNIYDINDIPEAWKDKLIPLDSE